MYKQIAAALILVASLVPLQGARGASTASYGGLRAQFSGTTDTLRAVACPTRAVCYAVGNHGRIVATTNGGQTWRSQRNPLSGLTDLSAITCPTLRTCYVAGGYMVAAAGPSGYFPPAEGAILHTTNGGRTWQQQRSRLGYTRLTGVTCSSATRCVIVGDRGNVLLTTDGGRSWHSMQAATHTELLAVACATAHTCTSVGILNTAVTTMDGGYTWASSSVNGTADLNGVTCAGAHACIAVGASGTIVRSTNGGQSWSAATTPYATTYVKPTFYSVSCAGGNVCYAVGLGNGHSAFAGSANAGQSWTDLGGSTTGILMGVSCPAVHICYAVGTNGAILKTNAATPGNGAPPAGGQAGGDITLDKVIISDTPGGPQTYIMHRTATEYFTAYYHASASGATGTVTVSENGTTLGTYHLSPGVAPDGSLTLSVALNMAAVQPGNITAQFTVRLGSATATQAATSLLISD